MKKEEYILITSTELYAINSYPTFMGNDAQNADGDYLEYWTIDNIGYVVSKNVFDNW